MERYQSILIVFALLSIGNFQHTRRSAWAEQLLFTPIVFPLMEARLSSSYGPRRHPLRKVVRHHHGVDLAAPKNSHVRAVAAGLVVFADTYGAFGKLSARQI